MDIKNPEQKILVIFEGRVGIISDYRRVCGVDCWTITFKQYRITFSGNINTEILALCQITTEETLENPEALIAKYIPNVISTLAQQILELKKTNQLARRK
jgi:hypothetical protein